MLQHWMHSQVAGGTSLLCWTGTVRPAIADAAFSRVGAGKHLLLSKAIELVKVDRAVGRSRQKQLVVLGVEFGLPHPVCMLTQHRQGTAQQPAMLANCFTEQS